MLKFNIGDKNIKFGENEIQEEKRFSKHTGEELCDYEIEIRLKGVKNKDWFENHLNDTWYKLDDNDEVISEYKSKMIQSSSSSQNDIYYYKVMLTEKENLEIDKLILGELEMEPYQYEEEFNKLEQNEEALMIRCKAETIYDDFLKQYLSSKGEYFDVVRNGINENPINMRFGKVTWSEAEDTEKIKIDFTLVEKNHDLYGNNSGIFAPEFYNLMSKTAYKSKLLDELIEYLISEDVLSKEKFNELKSKSKKLIGKETFNFYEKDNIDD